MVRKGGGVKGEGAEREEIHGWVNILTEGREGRKKEGGEEEEEGRI